MIFKKRKVVEVGVRHICQPLIKQNNPINAKDI